MRGYAIDIWIMWYTSRTRIYLYRIRAPPIKPSTNNGPIPAFTMPVIPSAELALALLSSAPETVADPGPLETVVVGLVLEEEEESVEELEVVKTLM
jgi:hypothetical protein